MVAYRALIASSLSVAAKALYSHTCSALTRPGISLCKASQCRATRAGLQLSDHTGSKRLGIHASSSLRSAGILANSGPRRVVIPYEGRKYAYHGKCLYSKPPDRGG